jgi:hypothetical protein
LKSQHPIAAGGKLVGHLAWIKATGASVSARPQPDDPAITVIRITHPVGVAAEEDVEAILRHWERLAPGTVDRDWLDESAPPGG